MEKKRCALSPSKEGILKHLIEEYPTIPKESIRREDIVLGRIKKMEGRLEKEKKSRRKGGEEWKNKKVSGADCSRTQSARDKLHLAK